jgi:RNA polymerase sigma-70 factor (ECF subfamily)
MQPIDPSDEVLAARVSAQDGAAFGMLYDRYARPVYVMAAHMLGGAEAEEIVQEVFLRLWRRAHQYRVERGPFKPWFMAIARHHVLDELRRRNLAPTVAADRLDQVLADGLENVREVEETAWSRERSEAVLHALKGIPAEQRRALVLAYFGDLSHRSIAEYLGWPLGTVKKRIRLGLQKLRDVLATKKSVVPPAGNGLGTITTHTVKSNRK